MKVKKYRTSIKKSIIELLPAMISLPIIYLGRVFYGRRMEVKDDINTVMLVMGITVVICFLLVIVFRQRQLLIFKDSIIEKGVFHRKKYLFKEIDACFYDELQKKVSFVIDGNVKNIKLARYNTDEVIRELKSRINLQKNIECSRDKADRDSSKKGIANFTVTLNWVGWFEVMVAFIGIIGMPILFRYMWLYMEQTGEKGKEAVICLSIPVFLMIFLLWAVMHPLFDRIKVNDNQLLIKQAFKKNKTIDVADVISYSNTEHTQKGHRYFTISIVYGENESIDIRSDIYKNYDILLHYLKKHVSKRNKNK